MNHYDWCADDDHDGPCKGEFLGPARYTEVDFAHAIVRVEVRDGEVGARFSVCDDSVNADAEAWMPRAELNEFYLALGTTGEHEGAWPDVTVGAVALTYETRDHVAGARLVIADSAVWLNNAELDELFEAVEEVLDLSS